MSELIKSIRSSRRSISIASVGIIIISILGYGAIRQYFQIQDTQMMADKSKIYEDVLTQSGKLQLSLNASSEIVTVSGDTSILLYTEKDLIGRKLSNLFQCVPPWNESQLLRKCDVIDAKGKKLKVQKTLTVLSSSNDQGVSSVVVLQRDH